MHTSGTTGKPKFCAQSHEYFIRLGRFFGDTACFSPDDVVVAPLPLFHINPLGYGMIGALTAGASALSMDKFDVKAFWPGIIENGASAVVLHLPPAELLRSKTTADHARGHRLRVGFACPPPFLEQFDIPIGLSGYGSTEAAGLCHMWTYRKRDRDFPSEGPTHLGGRSRYDVEWKLSGSDEVLVRGKAPNVLFAGYARGGAIDDGRDAEGWFHTGDRGRADAYGNLVFIERASESIRVNAEYVPIDFVEDRLKRVGSLADFALWRVNSDTRGHEAVVYTTSARVDVLDLRAAISDLPRYMHPTQIIRIEAIPRDAGVGKVQRRLLDAQPVLDITAL
jgi:acyl-CoA synthetase (AMP-forming)/AMP-acid ligase II